MSAREGSEARPEPGPALVTGASRGLGRAVALALAAAGHDVAIHYRGSAGEARAVAAEAEALGVRSLTVCGDLADLVRAGDVVGEAHAGLGGLSVLVNCVGDYLHRPLDELSLEEWRHMLDSNLSSTFATCRAALPLLRAGGGGRIVNFGYAGAGNLVARPGIVAYAIAKTGVVILTRSIAKAEAGHGITANVVAPGVMENSTDLPKTPIPVGRLGRAEEAAAAVLYFVSPGAAYVTGQVLEVSGGWNL